MFNEDTEEIEYLHETVCEDDDDIPEDSILMDFSDYWDEETMNLLKDIYFLAEA